METLSIPSRFRGPDRSGNGGWTAGALAATLASERTFPLPPVQVTLRTPPPLDRVLTVRHGPNGADLLNGDTLVASAEVLPAAQAPEPIAAVLPEEARAARDAFGGLKQHPFPHCFTCGSARAEGDGLRLMPGPVEPEGTTTRVATTWTPAASHAEPDSPDQVTLPVTWAALDCPGAWTVDLDNRAVVLGRMVASVDALPRVGEEHVVMGGLLGHEGRKWFTATTLHDTAGQVVARARHTWIEIDPGTFNT